MRGQLPLFPSEPLLRPGKQLLCHQRLMAIGNNDPVLQFGRQLLMNAYAGPNTFPIYHAADILPIPDNPVDGCPAPVIRLPVCVTAGSADLDLRWRRDFFGIENCRYLFRRSPIRYQSKNALHDWCGLGIWNKPVLIARGFQIAVRGNRIDVDASLGKAQFCALDLLGNIPAI